MKATMNLMTTVLRTFVQAAKETPAGSASTQETGRLIRGLAKTWASFRAKRGGFPWEQGDLFAAINVGKRQARAAAITTPDTTFRIMYIMLRPGSLPKKPEPSRSSDS